MADFDEDRRAAPSKKRAASSSLFGSSRSTSDAVADDVFDGTFRQPEQAPDCSIPGVPPDLSALMHWTDGVQTARHPVAIAERATQGAGEAFPFASQIQSSFGKHDISHARAHFGHEAVQASRQLDARAFTVGNRVAFVGAPDLHTAAHEAAHIVQQRSGAALTGPVDQPDDEFERHADLVADAVVRGESAERLLDQIASTGGGRSHGVQRKANTAPKAAAATKELEGNFDVASGGMSARIRRTWLRENALDHWLQVLLAMQQAGAVSWAKPDALSRFARRLADKYPTKDDVIAFRLDAIAIATIGLPPDATVKLERIGDDIMVIVPALESTGMGEALPVDSDHNGKQFTAVYRALERFTGLRAVEHLELGAIAASAHTGVMRLHDRELATIFGADAWEQWKHPRNKHTHAHARGASAVDAHASEPSDAGNASTPHELTPEERARIAVWFAKTGVNPPRQPTREMLGLIGELESNPILARAVQQQLHRGSGHEKPADENSLRAAIDRAKLELERSRLGLGRGADHKSILDAFLGETKQKDAFDTADVPARLVQQGLLLSGRKAHFDVDLNWGAYKASSDNEFANRPWHAIVEWVFERADAQGPARANGAPISKPETLETEHAGSKIGIDHTFRLAPHEQSGIWTVHAFIHSSHFAPKHAVTTVEVKTESARMADLRREAFEGMQPENATKTDHRFDNARILDTVFESIDLPGKKNGDRDGTIMRGDLPASFRELSPQERAEFRQREIHETEQLIAYLRSQGDPTYADALDAAKRRLTQLRQADKDIKKDEKSGWKSFELRGTYLSRRPEVPSGPLDLYGTVRRESIEVIESEVVEVQIRDHSQRLGPQLTMYTGIGSTFEAALEDAFLKLCKDYPEGKMSVLAQAMHAGRAGAFGTGKAIGFELATTAPWKRVKDRLYNPVTQTVINVAATALMIFQPELAPILLPILTVNNTVANVDDLVTRYNNHTLTTGHTMVSLAQIGLDLLPYARGAKILQTGTRLAVFEGVNLLGMTIVMGLQTRNALAQIQEQDVAALAETYREMIERQKWTNPSDPELAHMQREIAEGARHVRERVMDEWLKAIGQNSAFLVGTHVLGDMQRKIVGPPERSWAPGHRDAIGDEPAYETTKHQHDAPKSNSANGPKGASHEHRDTATEERSAKNLSANRSAKDMNATSAKNSTSESASHEASKGDTDGNPRAKQHSADHETPVKPEATSTEEHDGGIQSRLDPDVRQHLGGADSIVLDDVTRLATPDPAKFSNLLRTYGDSVAEYLRFNPSRDLADLGEALKHQAKQVRTHVDNVYTSIQAGVGSSAPAAGWDVHVENRGRGGWHSTIRDPNGHELLIGRKWDAASGTLTMDVAFGAPKMDMVPSNPAVIQSRGTPAMMYVNLHQMRAMGIPYGKGAVSSPLKTVKMSTIQNFETIGHLHWLRDRYPTTKIEELITHTASYRYAADIMTQAGYRVTGVRVDTLANPKIPMHELLSHYEDDHISRGLFQQSGAERKLVHDKMLSRYEIDADKLRAGGGPNIDTNFDIYLEVEPLP